MKDRKIFRATKITDRRLFICSVILIITSFSACTTFYTARGNLFDISGISAETRTNGIVVTISATKQIGHVEAWIGDNNWIYITIPDTSVDFTRLRRLEENPIIAEMKCFKYAEAFQISLQIKEKVDQLDVVRYPDDYDVYISLYRFKSESE